MNPFTLMLEQQDFLTRSVAETFSKKPSPEADDDTVRCSECHSLWDYKKPHVCTE